MIGLEYNGVTYFYQKDLLGNVIAILDSEGNIVVKYNYDAWGNHTVVGPDGYTQITDVTSIGIINPIRYRGYYYDRETGLYYLHSRYYDPVIGRFINIDDISYLDPETINGLNLYSYCLNNPVMYIDPTGKFPILALVLGITALVGLGLTVGGVASDNNVMTAVGLGMTGIAAIVSGGIALIGAIGTGAVLTGIIGGVTVLAGAGSLTFMSAEIQEATGNGNWIIDAGMSEGWYNGVMLTVATIATTGTFASSILSSSSKIGNTIIGEQFNPKRTFQIGVDPNSLTINRTLNPNKIKIVKKILKKDGMYGVIEVNRSGLIIDGNHRVFVAKMLKMAVDVIIL